MTYIAKLYVEGGSMDGEEVAVGPFEDGELADAAADELAARGSSNTITLYPSVREALAVIPD